MAKKRNSEHERTRGIKVAPVSSGKSSSGKASLSGKMSSSKSTSKKQRAAARRNIKKAQKVNKEYYSLRKRGFTKETIGEASEQIWSQITSSNLLSPENNPATAQLLRETGGIKTQEEIDMLSRGEYIKYATALRSFLGNPLSSEKMSERLNNSFSRDLIRGALVQGSQNREEYLQSRRRFIDSIEDSSKIFELYRRLTETNAGIILNAELNPMAYGSDNLIVDLFDFYDENGPFDMEKAVSYWTALIDERYNQLQKSSRKVGARTARSMKQFDWHSFSSYEEW